jgi:hypothetical protein
MIVSFIVAFSTTIILFIVIVRLAKTNTKDALTLAVFALLISLLELYILTVNLRI